MLLEIKLVTRLQSIPFKWFNNLVGRLHHAAIGLPAGRRLCSPFNRTIVIHPKRVHLGKKGLVCGALMDWSMLLVDMRARSTHVKELIPQDISDVSHMDASGIETGGGGG